MAITKSKDAWIVDIRVNGKRIRRTAKSKAEAKLVEARLRATPEKTEHTFDEALLRWLKGSASKLKSFENLKDKARLVREAIGDCPLSTVHLAANVAKSQWAESGLKPATINRRLAIVRRILNLAFQEWEWLETPTATKVKLLSEKNERHIYLTKPQARELIAAVEDPNAKAAVLLALSTGLRQGEILNLTPDNIVDGNIVLSAETKSGRPRTVPLPADALALDLPLNLSYDRLRYQFEKARDKVGRPDLHFHDLRHTYASWVIHATKDTTVVRDLLGHANLAVTSRYAHLMSDHLSDAITETFGEMDTLMDTQKEDEPENP